MDERFIPEAKRAKTTSVQTIRGLEPHIFCALNNYHPSVNKLPCSAASSVSGDASEGSWERVGGRVEGTNNVLLNWGNQPITDPRGSQLDEFGLGDAEDDAQKVIQRNIGDFLRLQMNRYVLDNRKLLDLSNNDVKKVQRNIIDYWLHKHKRIEEDPFYNFCELVAGALDEKVEFVLADARAFRQIYEGRTGTGREFRGFTTEKKTEKNTERSLGQTQTQSKVVEGQKQDAFISEEQYLLKKNQIVRDVLRQYAEDKVEGRNASIDADTFMRMLQDFEISGHIEVKPPLTNAWKQVHRRVLRTAYPPGVVRPTFFQLIPDEDIRAAYARATAFQMMVYRQLDKRRSYLAVDYERVKDELEEAMRDLIDLLRENGPLHQHSVGILHMTRAIAASSGRTVAIITDISGKLLPEVQLELENTFSQIYMKRGIKKSLTLNDIIATPHLSNIFGKYVGMQMRLKLDPKHQGRLTIEMQQRESEVNTMLTELMAVLRQNKYVKLPVDRYRMVCADF